MPYLDIIDEPWAIEADILAALHEVSLVASSEGLQLQEAKPIISSQNGKIAILPLFGVILSRGNIPSFLGITSAEAFGKQFTKLINDPDIGSIILDVNSPGGQIGGIQELSDRIFNARGKKPIVAIANHIMDAGAYWIGTAAHEVVITPSGQVGSIGIVAIHEDISGQLEKEGLKISLISAGKYKTEANKFEPLSKEGRLNIQSRVSEANNAFINTIARNRGVPADKVRNGYGEGRPVSANKAIQLGMVDRIETMDELINRLQSAGPSLPSKGLQPRGLSSDMRIQSEELSQKGKEILHNPKLIKRSEYDRLSLVDRARFVKSGGIVED